MSHILKSSHIRPFYPNWICLPCGTKYGRRDVGEATWHPDICDVCGKQAGVTEPRDFGHLNPGWENHMMNAGEYSDD